MDGHARRSLVRSVGLRLTLKACHLTAGPTFLSAPGLCGALYAEGRTHREIPYSGRKECALNDLPELRRRAEDLRQRISDFLKDFGHDVVPQLPQLRDELAQIEDRLRALGEADNDEPQG